MPEAIATSVVERFLARSNHGTGMVFDCSIFLRGDVDLARLEQVWIDTVTEIPRLYCPLMGRGRSQVWKCVPFDRSKFKVELTTTSDRNQLIKSVNVRRGRGCKLVVTKLDGSAPDDANCKLRFFFHHAACDGVGGARAVFQTFQRYHDSTRTLKLKRETHAIAKAGDTKPALTIPHPRNVWATIRGHNARLLRHAIKQPSSGLLRVPQKGVNSIAQMRVEDAHVRIRFDQNASSMIRQRLRQGKVPFNDFAVAIALASISKTTLPHRRRYLSIMNPVEMRAWSNRRCPNNHIGFAFVRRRHDELSSIGEIIESVHQQMSSVRAHGTANELASGISTFERIPGSLALAERLGFFVPTASVTCMTSLKFGKRFGFQPGPESSLSPDRASGSFQSYFLGDAEVKDFEFLAPLPLHAQMAITAWDNGRSIALTLRTRSPCEGGTARDLIETASVIGQHWIDVTAGFLQTTEVRSVHGELGDL